MNYLPILDETSVERDQDVNEHGDNENGQKVLSKVPGVLLLAVTNDDNGVKEGKSDLGQHKEVPDDEKYRDRQKYIYIIEYFGCLHSYDLFLFILSNN